MPKHSNPLLEIESPKKDPLQNAWRDMRAMSDLVITRPWVSLWLRSCDLVIRPSLAQSGTFVFGLVPRVCQEMPYLFTPQKGNQVAKLLSQIGKQCMKLRGKLLFLSPIREAMKF